MYRMRLLVALFLLFQISFGDDYSMWSEPECIKKGFCPKPGRGDGYPNYEERKMMYLLNFARLDPIKYQQIYKLPKFGCHINKQLGVDPLPWKPALSALSKAHSYDMATTDCFKLETCGDCEKYGGCDPETRAKKFYYPKVHQIIGRGRTIDLANEWLSDTETCELLMDSDLSEIGTGFWSTEGSDGYWTLAAGTGSASFAYTSLISETYEVVSDGVIFSVIYKDMRKDENLKHSFLVINEEIFPMKIDRGFNHNQDVHGSSGVYFVKISNQQLENFASDGHINDTSKCHYYHFKFVLEHSQMNVHLPESGFFYLNGFGGCMDLYTQYRPETAYNKKMDEEENILNEKRRVMREEKIKKKVEMDKILAQSERQKFYYNVFLFVAAAVIVLMVLKRKRPLSLVSYFFKPQRPKVFA